MFKKINQYLITHYPLVWNLKLVWILSVGLILNLIAFTNGYLHYNHPSQLLDYNITNAFFAEYYVFYYFFFAIIILIIWLYFYFKNNRFKSSLPTSRNYLFKEFLGIFSVILLFLCIPNVFNYGLKLHIGQTISDEKFAKDVEIINAATPFTLHHNNAYSNFSRNLSVPVFDTLVTDADVKKAFDEDMAFAKKNYKGKVEFTYEKPYFRNPQFNKLLVDRLKDQIKFSEVSFQENHIGYDDTIYSDEIDQVKLNTIEPNIEYNFDETIANEEVSKFYSLYNFSKIILQVPNQPEKNQRYFDEKLIDVLNRNDRKAIETLLNDYLNICDFYQIGYRFEKKKWIDYIPQAPYFYVNQELGNSEFYRDNVKIEKDYINSETVSEVYKRIETAKFENVLFENFQYFILFALMLSIAIITFRFTSFKVWLISGIGFGILIILLSCFYFLISLFTNFHLLGYLIPIVTYFIFIGLIYVGLKNNTNKLVTGVVLNWFTASSLFIILFILSCYKEYREEILHQQHAKDLEFFDVYNSPEIKNLNHMIDLYFYYNPIVYIIFFYFIILCYRKWQAMAEE